MALPWKHNCSHSSVFALPLSVVFLLGGSNWAVQEMCSVRVPPRESGCFWTSLILL